MLRLLLMTSRIDSTCSFILPRALSMCNCVVCNGVALWILASTAAAAATTTAAATATTTATTTTIVLLWDGSNSGRIAAQDFF
jgi:hypothetical protein